MSLLPVKSFMSLLSVKTAPRQESALKHYSKAVLYRLSAQSGAFDDPDQRKAIEKERRWLGLSHKEVVKATVLSLRQYDRRQRQAVQLKNECPSGNTRNDVG